MRRLVLLCLSCILACACGGGGGGGGGNGGGGGGNGGSGGGSSEPSCIAREAGADEIAISNATQLAGMALSGKYILTSDISLAGLNWVPIGDDDPILNPSEAFTGELDGNCYAITELTIDSTSLESVGLFAALNGAKISNLILKDVKITAENNTGLMAGSIAGYAMDSEITNSYSTGAIEAKSLSNGADAGGIVGSADASNITNSYSTGAIEAKSLSNSADAGGIVGSAKYSTITNSYSTGAISAFSNGVYAEAGGIAGSVYYSTITNSYSAGDVSATATSGDALAGGIVGYFDDIVVENCAAINPSISATYSAGRIIGNGGGTTDNNIALDSMIAGDDTFDDSIPEFHGTDATIAELQSQATYSTTLGWDFTNIWKMDSSISKYPVLIWQE